MTGERDFLARLQDIATDPAARGLTDDAAIWDIGDQKLVLTHDMMIEGVHYRANDPADSVAWKLVAVNFSDLAAKGARPLACLMGYGLGHDAAWDAGFVRGLQQALDHYGAILLGGDTVSQPAGDARCLGLTAIGRATVPTPPGRDGAKAGDQLYVTGAIGNGWAGLQMLSGIADRCDYLITAYRQPVALVAEGIALAQVAHAMMDVSDGLLIDAKRMADASKLSLEIRLDAIPLCPEFIAAFGHDQRARLNAVTGGDDYQLLFAADPEALLPVNAHAIGIFTEGDGCTLTNDGMALPLPDRIGWLH